jgi:hypothetical protein
MSGRIVVFGATGYTGGLIAERLVAAGQRPILAGRDTGRLAAVAERLGADLEVKRADAHRSNAVYDLVGAGDVLIATVGPFAKWGAVAVRAAAAAGATYLDSTGESTFIRRVFEEFDAPAQASGAKLLTAMGYDYVPGALAGGLALQEAGEAATRVDVAYFVLGSTRDFATAGTKESAIGVTLDPSFAFRDGQIVTERGAARVRRFGDRQGFTIGGAEHFTLPSAFPQLRDVDTYLGVFGPLSHGVQAVSLATSLVTKVPGSREVLRRAGERLAALAPERVSGSDTTSQSMAVAVASDERGRELAQVTVKGPDVYDFTATFMAWAAQQEIEGTGALSPVLAFGGLDGLVAGCAAAGLSAS